MIKQVTGVKSKLSAARDMGFKYCKVSVDGNNIGCALIDDILDSINYCNTAGGKIRTFIHRGYEYPVDEGIEITVLTDANFQSHYLAMSESSGGENHSLCRTTEEGGAERGIRGNSLELLQSVGHRLNEINARHEIEENYDDNIVGYQPPKEEKKKESLITRFKHWLKGDVRYKK